MRLLDLLHQDETWTDAQGVERRIPDMTPQHRRNTEAYLLRNADGLADSIALEYHDMPMPSGEEAHREVEASIEQILEEIGTDPMAWLKEQKLIKALRSGCSETVWQERGEPYGCKHCGIPARRHIHQWMPDSGSHSWTAPGDLLIKARMRARDIKKWGDPR